MHFALGMSGILAGIPLCPEGQANAGTCSQSSEIGETTVSVGLGGEPFTVTVRQGPPLGAYANLAKAKVSLPKQMPSRLTTLQKACTAAIVAANPARRPKESIVGQAGGPRTQGAEGSPRR
jgi:hypothetical protein